MATKTKLQGSFGSLSDTLAFRFDPSQPPEVVSAWLGTMAHAAATARRTNDWMALPPEAPDYDDVIAVSDDATHALVMAVSTGERLEALNRAEHALDRLDALLDRATELQFA